MNLVQKSSSVTVIIRHCSYSLPQLDVPPNPLSQPMSAVAEHWSPNIRENNRPVLLRKALILVMLLRKDI